MQALKCRRPRITGWLGEGRGMRSARGSWAGPRIPGEIRPESVSTTLMGDEAGAADPQPVGAELEEIWDCAEEAPARSAAV